MIAGTKLLPLLLDAYRRFGIRDEQIVVVPGAATRAARMFVAGGWNRGIQASVVHHTAGSPTTLPHHAVDYILHGRGEGFVVSNTYIDNPVASGLAMARVWILATAGGTYTEGAGGPRHLIPEDGANRVVFSAEIANDGTGLAKYPESQIDLVVRTQAAQNWLFAQLFDWDEDAFAPHRLFSHAEWTPRKSDPAGECEFEDGTGRRFYDTRVWNEDRLRQRCSDLEVAITSPLVIHPSDPEQEKEPDMLTLWRPQGYQEVFVFGGPRVYNVDAAIAATLTQRGVPSVTAPLHIGPLQVVAKESGLTHLTRVNGERVLLVDIITQLNVSTP